MKKKNSEASKKRVKSSHEIDYDRFYFTSDEDIREVVNQLSYSIGEYKYENADGY